MSPFTAFSQQLNIRSGIARHLIGLANNAATVQEMWHNGDATDDQADTAMQAVITYAANFGIRTTWPGLYPNFHREGRTIYLPG